MSEFDPSVFAPFRATETVNEFEQRTWLIDGNSAEAEALPTEEFWKLIIGESRIKAFTPPISQNLMEFFGKEESPDELIVVSPLRDTRASSPIRRMVASCIENISALKGDLNELYLPAYPWEDLDHDILISVRQGDWATIVPHHDSADSNGYTVFRSSKARLPKGFLTSLNGNLTLEQMELMQAGLEQISPVVE